MAKPQSPDEGLGFVLPPRVMQMLGRENVSSPIIALLELVKNAYDADATTVTVTMRRASTNTGFIAVEDDGEGMSLHDLRKKWMVISTDNKVRDSVTKKYKRVKVGEKGIGRLSLDRLARSCELITHIASQSGVRLSIDWNKYESTQGELGQIKHPYWKVAPTFKGRSGTTIYLTGLRDNWSRDDYEILYSDLALLVPPFVGRHNDDNFSIVFDCDEAPGLFGPIPSVVVKAAEYKLESRLTAEGRIHHRLRHRSGRMARYDRSWGETFPNLNMPTPACGPVRFILYFYVRERETLREIGVKSSDLKKFLDAFKGVRIYRDNVRVKPYGDPLTGEDWLGLNARRVSHPGGVVSEKSGSWFLAGNQVVGSVYITREDNAGLIDQTNREGLAHNRAYLDLRRFVLHSIQFLESERIRQTRESPPAKPSKETVAEAIESIRDEALVNVRALREATQDLKGTLFGDQSSVALDASASRDQAIAQAIEVVESAFAEMQTERQLMVGLATLGIAMAAFGHETIQSINTILANAGFLKQNLRLINDLIVREQARQSLEKLTTAAQRIEAWGQFALDRVRSDKRQRRNIDLNRAIQAVLAAFDGTLKRRDITVQTDFQADLPSLRAFSMDVEAIIINLVTNAVEALRPVVNRLIRVSTKYLAPSRQFQIVFADNGRGIHPDDLPKIFDPMFTTKLNARSEPEGTGLGLTIVNNIVTEYDGTISVQGHGSLGGAEFTILLPRRFAREE